MSTVVAIPALKESFRIPFRSKCGELLTCGNFGPLSIPITPLGPSSMLWILPGCVCWMLFSGFENVSEGPTKIPFDKLTSPVVKRYYIILVLG
jgi:hypothetical protein